MTAIPCPAPRAAALPLAAALGVAAFALAPAPAEAQSPCGPTTTVQAGDTYFSIAQRCDVSVGALEAANPGVNPRDLRIGQTLDLAADGMSGRSAERQPLPAQRAPTTEERYQVQPGDTLYGIAAALGTTVEALIAANPDIDPDFLRIGDVLLPPRHEPGPPGEPQPGMRVTGVLTQEGVECPAMRGHDGRLYTLLGDLDEYDSGDVVEVVGTEPDASFCQQGTTIDVDRIRQVG